MDTANRRPAMSDAGFDETNQWLRREAVRLDGRKRRWFQPRDTLALIEWRHVARMALTSIGVLEAERDAALAERDAARTRCAFLQQLLGYVTEVNRYSHTGRYGGLVQSRYDASGEWVRWSDVERILSHWDGEQAP